MTLIHRCNGYQWGVFTNWNGPEQTLRFHFLARLCEAEYASEFASASVTSLTNVKNLCLGLFPHYVLGVE